MNTTCFKLSLFSAPRIWPFRSMFIVSYPCKVRHAVSNDSQHNLQLLDGVIAWGIAWVVASLAHGLGGQIRAYLYQTQRAPKFERLQTVGFPPSAHSGNLRRLARRRLDSSAPGCLGASLTKRSARSCWREPGRLHQPDQQHRLIHSPRS
jgi:hypothetical protein